MPPSSTVDSWLKCPTRKLDDFVSHTPASFRSTLVVGRPSYATAIVVRATAPIATPAIDAAVFGLVRTHDSAFILSQPPLGVAKRRQHPNRGSRMPSCREHGYL